MVQRRKQRAHAAAVLRHAGRTAARIATAFTQIGAAATAAAAQLNDGFVRISVVANASSPDMASLRLRVLSFSRLTGFPTEDVLDAALRLAATGVPIREIDATALAGVFGLDFPQPKDATS
jgi:hypothetical protein